MGGVLSIALAYDGLGLGDVLSIALTVLLAILCAPARLHSYSFAALRCSASLNRGALLHLARGHIPLISIFYVCQSHSVFFACSRDQHNVLRLSAGGSGSGPWRLRTLPAE